MTPSNYLEHYAHLPMDVLAREMRQRGYSKEKVTQAFKQYIDQERYQNGRNAPAASPQTVRST